MACVFAILQGLFHFAVNISCLCVYLYIYFVCCDSNLYYSVQNGALSSQVSCLKTLKTRNEIIGTWEFEKTGTNERDKGSRPGR
jgi:hypothetical protein